MGRDTLHWIRLLKAIRSKSSTQAKATHFSNSSTLLENLQSDVILEACYVSNTDVSARKSNNIMPKVCLQLLLLGTQRKRWFSIGSIS